MLVIGQFTKRCPAKRSLIDWRICVNPRLKPSSVNGGVFLVHNLECLVLVCGRRKNTGNERMYGYMTRYSDKEKQLISSPAYGYMA